MSRRIDFTDEDLDQFDPRLREAILRLESQQARARQPEHRSGGLGEPIHRTTAEGEKARARGQRNRDGSIVPLWQD